jgi:hypothetical protein
MKHFRAADPVKSSAFIVAGLTVIGLALIFGFTQTPSDAVADAAETSSIRKTQATTPPPTDANKDIGAVETKSPPPPSPGVMSGPGANASTGTTETGPHGTVDVTKPMQNAPPTAPRIETDQPVAPTSPAPKN